MGDHPTGVSLFAAIMTALYQRNQTGRGTMVSTSLLANGVWWNAIQIQAALCGARVEPRPPREQPASALANLYRCADGRWFLLNLLNDDRDWPHLLRAIARPDLGDDPRFAATPARRAHAQALVAHPGWGLRRQPWRMAATSWTTTASRSARSGRWTSPRRSADGRQRRPGADRRPARRSVADRLEPVLAGERREVAPRLAPELGEHSTEILREIGYGQAEIDKLVAARVVVQGKPAA